MAVNRRTTITAAVSLLAGVSMLAACGSDAASTADDDAATSQTTDRTDTSLDGAAPVCAELQVVKDLSDEISQVTDDILSTVLSAAGDGSELDEAALLTQFDEVARSLDASLSDVLDAYESAARLAEPQIADDIRVVADGTAVLTPVLVAVFVDATSLDDLAALDTAFEDPEIVDAATSAGLASLRLDDFTVPECGFQFSN